MAIDFDKVTSREFFLKPKLAKHHYRVEIKGFQNFTAYCKAVDLDPFRFNYQQNKIAGGFIDTIQDHEGATLNLTIMDDEEEKAYSYFRSVERLIMPKRGLYEYEKNFLQNISVYRLNEKITPVRIEKYNMLLRGVSGLSSSFETREPFEFNVEYKEYSTFHSRF